MATRFIQGVGETCSDVRLWRKFPSALTSPLHPHDEY